MVDLLRNFILLGFLLSCEAIFVADSASFNNPLIYIFLIPYYLAPEQKFSDLFINLENHTADNYLIV